MWRKLITATLIAGVSLGLAAYGGCSKGGIQKEGIQTEEPKQKETPTSEVGTVPVGTNTPVTMPAGEAGTATEQITHDTPASSADAIAEAIPLSAIDDTYRVEEDKLGRSGASVLANDTAPAGSTPKVTGVTNGPSHAEYFKLDADGSGNFLYMPALHYCGTDSFQYSATDATSTSNTATVTIRVACARRTQTFGGSQDYTVSSAPIKLLTGDIDGDRNVDIVIQHEISANDQSDISVFMGKGDGTFANPMGISTGINVKSIAVADIDRNGLSDLVAFSQDGALYVNLSNANTPNQGGLPIQANFKYRDVITGDFNGDGKLDLAFALSDGVQGLVIIMAGDGAGTFANQLGVNGQLAYAPESILAGDFNGDGKLDVVTLNPKTNNASILYMDDNFMLRPPVNVRVGESPTDIAVADMNQDQRADIAITSTVATLQANTSLLSVIYGNGDLSIIPAAMPVELMPAIQTPKALLIADFDKDGKNDFAAANSGARTDIWTMLAAEISSNFGGDIGPFADILAADFNNDGLPDIAAVKAQSRQFSVFLNAKIARSPMDDKTVDATPSGTSQGNTGSPQQSMTSQPQPQSPTPGAPAQPSGGSQSLTPNLNQ